MTTLGQRLKHLRSQAEKTQEEIAVALNRIGVNASRVQVARWENDLQEPTLTPTMGLAKIYGVTSDYIINGVEYNHDLANDPISDNIRHTVSVMRELTDKGQKAVADHADLIKASGKYDRPAAPSPIDISEYMKPYATFTSGAAAAGDGFMYGDENKQYRTFMTMDIPKHDFSVDVSGDSMFPTLFDKDVAFVKKNYDKVDGQIYVLDIDGETVIKRVYFEDNEITLVSDNLDWADRVVTGSELERTRILGRVVGWETPIR